MRKAVLVTLMAAFLLVPLASAEVSQTGFTELPSAWETGQELEFSMTSTGSGLEQVILQSRRPGEPGFTDRRSRTCTDYDECDWSLQHSESQTRTYEYRFRVQSQDGYGNTRTQEVTYYSTIDYSVGWTNQPPETSSEGESLEMSVTAHDSAGRFDTEGVLHLQYQNISGGWESFDTRSCSNSRTEDMCSNSGSTTLDSEKLEDGVARFRGLIVFDGDISTASSTRTVSLPGEDGEIDSVNLNDLPNEAVDEESFEITAEAQGENLQTLYIQKRDPDDPGWTDWRSENCNGNSDCSLTRTYSVSGTGEMEFRAYVEATGASDSTEGQVVDFIPQDIDSINSVTLDSLPDEKNVENSVQVTGEAEGNNLDQIVLRTRKSGESWQDETSQSCEEDTCSFDYSFSTEDPGTVEFQLEAHAGEETRRSESIEVIEFYQDEGRSVSDVNLDGLPSNHPTGEILEINGDAEGTNLERIILQKRDPSGDWQQVTSQSCSGNSCEFSYDYTQDDAEEVDFRLRAEAGSSSDISDSETVNFEEGDTGEINSVSINGLPSTHPTGENLEITGEAEGTDLDQIIIQQRDSGEGNWNDYRSRDCNNEDSCEITRDFSTGSETEKEFRIKAEAGGSSDTSSVETVSFTEDQQDRIDTVSIESLPEEHPVGESLGISGDASGRNLQTIRIQRRQSGSWSNYRNRECGGDSTCTISGSFTAGSTGEQDFRIKIETGQNTRYSSSQTVNFFTPHTVSSVTINEISDRKQVDTGFEVSGSMTGRNLGTLELQRREGSGSWETIETQSCSGSSCSLSIQRSEGSTGNYEYRFRGISGSETQYSGIQVVEVYQIQNEGEPSTPDPRPLQIELRDTAERKVVGESVRIQASGTGENLEHLQIQVRNETGDPWRTLGTEDCLGEQSCSTVRFFTAGEAGDYFFRAILSNSTDSVNSEISSTEFYVPEDVNSVEINSLPDEYRTGRELQVTGYASGSSLDQLVLEKRYSGGSWMTVSTEDCSESDTCTLSSEYTEDNPKTTEFRFYTTAGGRTRYSGIEVVDFTRPDIDELLESLSVSAPSSGQVGNNVTIEGEAVGTNLDSIALEYQEGGSWNQLDERNCNASPCNIMVNYSRESPGTTDFRTLVTGSGQSMTSEIDQTVFYPENGIISVEISNLPLEHPSGVELEVSGSAEGQNLEELLLQTKTSGSSWETIQSRECTGSPCSVETSFTEEEVLTRDFRTKAFAAGGNATSSVETVDFVHAAGFSVTLSSLPDEYSVGDSLDVDAYTTGDVERLDIQFREGSGSWRDLDGKSCSGSSCSLDTSYTASNPGTVEFRAMAETLENRKYSDRLEVVEFINQNDESNSDTGLDVKVEDEDGRDLEDALVRVSNGEDRLRYTGENGESSFELEPGSYEIRASKPGYEAEEREVDIDEGERKELEFELQTEDESGRFVSLEYPDAVCEGRNLEVQVRVTNLGSGDRFRISGSGMGESPDSGYLRLEEGETGVFELEFSNVRSDDGNFEVEVENSETLERSGSVNVRDCVKREKSNIKFPTGVSATLDPEKVIQGKTVKIKGDVQGIKRPVDVKASASGFSRTVSSTRDGSYTIFYTPSQPGEHEITISSGGISTKRTLEVLPSASVSSLETPDTVVEGEKFEICAEVNSGVNASVILFRDGSRIDSKRSSGRTCFKTEAGESGEKMYWVRAATEGETGSASQKVTVIEAEKNFESFPSQISVRKTEPGQARVTVYNKQDSTRKFSLEVKNMEDTWFSMTEQKIVLTPGEKEEVYIYFSPEKEGDYRADITVSSKREEVYRRRINIYSSGTDEPSVDLLDILL